MRALGPETAAGVHALFEYGGIALGVALYRRARRDAQQPPMTAPGSFALMAGLLIGAALGNQFHIRIMTFTNHAVRYYSTQQRFDASQQCNCKSRAYQLFKSHPVNVWDNRGWN